MKIVLLNRFHSWPDGVERSYPCITLRPNTWNDYGFETYFTNATIWLAEEEPIVLGAVKIGRYGYTSEEPSMRVELPRESPSLVENYFSLGQTAQYYRVLASLTAAIRAQYAEAMRDVPILALPIDRLEEEEVFRVSLLRDSSAREALDMAPGLFGRVARQVDAFTFESRLEGASGVHRIPFDFAPKDDLPYRINVLVGVNGVGKTQLMARLAVLLSRFQEEAKVKSLQDAGETFETLGSLTPVPSLYGVIAISFSAFDDFELPEGHKGREPADAPEDDGEPKPDFKYAYCGLRESDGSIFRQAGLAVRIPAIVERMSDTQRELLTLALNTVLPGHPTAANDIREEEFYSRLSAGQRIVLNMVADLILHIRPRSLVLLDEPETHLHPQLLTTLLSVVNDLLEANDSFAVIATHSPIVVQQVLARRVHKIRRVDGDIPLVDPPGTETFGENLSEIVRTVFDALESDRDYEEVIDRLLDQNGGDPEGVMALFNGSLGLNAQIYLRSRGAKN